MERVLEGTQGDVSLLLQQDGEAVDADSTPTVTVTREDGTELVAGASVTRTGVGQYVYTLGPSLTGMLDVLTVEWAATLNGEAQTFTSIVEVVGGFLFTLAQLDALVEPTDIAGGGDTYPPADLADARTAAELALSDACGVSFTPRYRRAKLDGTGGTDILLPSPEVRRVRSASIDGEALTAEELDALEVYPDSGVVYREAGWPAGRRNVEVVFEHGFHIPPGRVPGAALQLARYLLVDSPIDARAISVTNEDGTVQVFATAGVRGAVFSVPEANAVVRAHSYPAVP